MNLKMVVIAGIVAGLLLCWLAWSWANVLWIMVDGGR